MDGYKILSDAGVNGFAYPGHPILLAYVVISAFESYAAASAKTASGYSAALSDNRVPGAGDHVACAMRILEMGSRGESLDSMIQAAHSYWDSGRAGGHLDNVEQGREDAKQIESAFRKRYSQWDISLPPASGSGVMV